MLVLLPLLFAAVAAAPNDWSAAAPAQPAEFAAGQPANVQYGPWVPQEQYEFHR